MTDFFQQHQLNQLNQEVQSLKNRAYMPHSSVPMSEEDRKVWQKFEEESKKTWGIPGFLATSVGFLLIVIEVVAAMVLTWLYVGSDKGLKLVLAGGPTVVALHWDPFIAAALSLVAGVAWAFLFRVPILGPLAGTAASALWGVALYAGTGSLAFGVFVFVASLLARMVMRTTKWRWLPVAEWGLVAVAAVVALAPFGTKVPLPGFGGWQALRQVHDTQTCDKELRAGAWKGQYTATPAFYAARTACVSMRARR